MLRSVLVFTACGVALLGGCAKSPPPADTSAAAVEASTQEDAAAQAAALAATRAADEAKAAELAAKERELADREAVLKQQELEAALAKADAENAAAAAAASAAAAKQATAKKAAAKPAASTAAAPKAVAPVAPIVVPAGTRLAIELVTPLSTKTNRVGNAVEGRLASDLMIGDRRAAKAGAAVRGSVVQVIAGTRKIGGTPTLGISFDSLVAANGASVSINAPYTQVGKSETGKDTAKIIGGAAAGAIIGHQVSDSNGAVVGGLLGGAAGTAAAKNTGGQVALAAGEVVNVTTQSSFEVKP